MHDWFKSYGVFAEHVDSAYWCSCNGKGLRSNGLTPSSFCTDKIQQALLVWVMALLTTGVAIWVRRRSGLVLIDLLQGTIVVFSAYFHWSRGGPGEPPLLCPRSLHVGLQRLHSTVDQPPLLNQHFLLHTQEICYQCMCAF